MIQRCVDILIEWDSLIVEMLILAAFRKTKGTEGKKIFDNFH